METVIAYRPRRQYTGWNRAVKRTECAEKALFSGLSRYVSHYRLGIKDGQKIDPDSTSGNLVPTAEIMKAFPDEHLNSDKLHANGEFFEAVSYSGSHQAGLQAVVKGDVDVVPVSDQIMASEIASGNVKKSDLKVIHESGDIPAEAMVVGEQVNDETKQFLTNFLTNYDNQEYFEKVIKVPNARFVPCTLDDYQDIIDLNNVINNAG